MFKFSETNTAWILSLSKHFLPYSNAQNLKKQNKPYKAKLMGHSLSKWLITFILTHRRQSKNKNKNSTIELLMCRVYKSTQKNKSKLK